jgi:hypothetical protein
MSLAVLCFLLGTIGGAAGYFVSRWVRTPRVRIEVVIGWKDRPVCPQCGLELNTRPLLEAEGRAEMVES